MCERACLECRAPLDGRDDRTRFCDGKCGKAWNNRWMLRGAELYDLFMAYRYDREASKLLGLWSLICRMGAVWNAEDKEAGRSSYLEPAKAKENMLVYLGTIVQRRPRRPL